ncbi:MAG TPA: hypothetical protein VKB12_03435, partial [Pyrinomonadaceae bacterium]|nr:hypothetical protein [Pyrinomonadaceae bacterium]
PFAKGLDFIRKIVFEELRTRRARAPFGVLARGLSTGVSHEHEKARGRLAASPLPLGLDGGRAALCARAKL